MAPASPSGEEGGDEFLQLPDEEGSCGFESVLNLCWICESESESTNLCSSPRIKLLQLQYKITNTDSITTDHNHNTHRACVVNPSFLCLHHHLWSGIHPSIHLSTFTTPLRHSRRVCPIPALPNIPPPTRAPSAETWNSAFRIMTLTGSGSGYRSIAKMLWLLTHNYNNDAAQPEAEAEAQDCPIQACGHSSE